MVSANCSWADGTQKYSGSTYSGSALTTASGNQIKGEYVQYQVPDATVPISWTAGCVANCTVALCCSPDASTWYYVDGGRTLTAASVTTFTINYGSSVGLNTGGNAGVGYKYFRWIVTAIAGTGTQSALLGLSVTGYCGWMNTGSAGASYAINLANQMAWQTLLLLNGTISFGSGYQVPQYCIDAAGWVCLRGAT